MKKIFEWFGNSAQAPVRDMSGDAYPGAWPDALLDPSLEFGAGLRARLERDGVALPIAPKRSAL